MKKSADPETLCSLPEKEFFRQLPIIDAHHHFWRLGADLSYPWLEQEPWITFRYGDYGRIRRNYLPSDYRTDAASHNIVATVHMEAEVARGAGAEEIAWLQSLGDDAPAAAIAQAWLDADNIAEQLNRLKTYGLVRAVRHKPAAMTRENARRGATGSMDDPKWRDGYSLLNGQGLHFELQTPFWHLDAAAGLARDFPETRIALNHCGLPADRSPEGLEAWKTAMEHLAREPNVFVKLSGIGLGKDHWPIEANMEIVQTAIRIFGADRSMFASNFPVDKICVDMDTMWMSYKRAVQHFPRTEVLRLFSGTARDLYKIEG